MGWTDELVSMLSVSALVFIEEGAEDVIVSSANVFKHRLPGWLAPNWSRITFFSELADVHERDHPKQVVDNPTLIYREMPFRLSFLAMSMTIFVQLMHLLVLFGFQWHIGCTNVMTMYDNSLVWWQY